MLPELDRLLARLDSCIDLTDQAILEGELVQQAGLFFGWEPVAIRDGSLVIACRLSMRALLTCLPRCLGTVFEHDVGIRCMGCVMDQTRQCNIPRRPRAQCLKDSTM